MTPTEQREGFLASVIAKLNKEKKPLPTSLPTPSLPLKKEKEEQDGRTNNS